MSDFHGIRDRCSCALAAAGTQGYAYNEEAFGYLLRVQRKRSDRADRPFLLLLVDLKEESGASNRIDPPIARAVFSALWQTLRENDVIGWYKEGQIAAALVTECDPAVREPTAEIIVQRVTRGLVVSVPPPIAARLQVRICRIQSKLTV